MKITKLNQYGYRYFEPNEFQCRHTGKNEMETGFVKKLDELRHRCGFPFIITSGFRDATHPVEAKKEKPGTHSRGIAADIKVDNAEQRYNIIKFATELGFRGIGVHQHFVHVDMREEEAAWDYGR